MVDRNGNYGVPAIYKKDIIVMQLMPGNDTPVLTRRLIGCWPTEQTADELSYDSAEEALTVTVQFSVDTAGLE